MFVGVGTEIPVFAADGVNVGEVVCVELGIWFALDESVALEVKVGELVGSKVMVGSDGISDSEMLVDSGFGVDWVDLTGGPEVISCSISGALVRVGVLRYTSRVLISFVGLARTAVGLS